MKQEVKVEVEQKPKNLDLLHGLLERRKNQEQKSEIKKEEKTEIDDILGKRKYFSDESQVIFPG